MSKEGYRKACCGLCVGGLWDGRWHEADEDSVTVPTGDGRDTTYEFLSIKTVDGDGDIKTFGFWTTGSSWMVIRRLVDCYEGLYTPKREDAA